MESRPLAGTGPPLTRLGLGMAALGRPAYITVGHAADLPPGRSVEAVEAHAHRVLDGAFAAGIRYFDAARSYGRAEQFLRAWIDSRGIRPAEIAVGSKWGYRYTGGWQVDGRVQEVKDHGEAMLEKQAAESLSLLGPWLRLYQIHSATPQTGVLEDARVLARLGRLREQGLYLGVTASGPEQAETVRRALEVRLDGAPLFSAVQATWNVLERSAGEALREAHRAGVTVLVKEPLANGILAQADGPLAAAARRAGIAPDLLALAFVLKESWADVVLLGAATVEQVESNVRALGVSLQAGVVSRLDALVQAPDAYWERRSRLPWN
ncbi:MAG TPA: aldo/keto reductase [Myxococcales bacterium]|nr:aldo/keto reductase [Myxococcales bacterium]